jgi:arsenate reductase
MGEPFPVTIYHNPGCGTSRNTLEMIRACGYAPTVVDYLEVGWDRATLTHLLSAMGVRPREVMRTKGTPAEAMGLLAGDVTDDAILEAMLAHPVLVNRPIVQTPLGVTLCRPSETVFALLERRPDRFVKEDGEVV